MSGIDFVFNIAKGRVGELYRRVDANDPTNSQLVLVVLAASGLEADNVLVDKDTLADVLSGTTNEVTNTGYGTRKAYTDASIAFPAPDDTNDRFDFDIGDPLWTGVAAGDVWAKLLVCYQPDSTVTNDALIIPLTAHSFDVTPDGTDISGVVAVFGFFRAA